MFQLRLDNCTLIGRLVICDTMFDFCLADGFYPLYFFVYTCIINYKVSIENLLPTLKDIILSCKPAYLWPDLRTLGGYHRSLDLTYSNIYGITYSGSNR